jgi:hypothetical protein
METPRDATSNPAALEEEVHPEAVCEFVPAVGRRWQGRGLAFPKKPERRLECTLLAYWAEGHEDGWYVPTDLPPQVADAAWYGLRMWIEHGFKRFKSDGWQWHESRITDPDRAGRVWLAMAVATRWVLSVGGREDARRGPVETMPAVATRAPEGRTGSAPAATATDPRLLRRTAGAAAAAWRSG